MDNKKKDKRKEFAVPKYYTAIMHGDCGYQILAAAVVERALIDYENISAGRMKETYDNSRESIRKFLFSEWREFLLFVDDSIIEKKLAEYDAIYRATMFEKALKQERKKAVQGTNDDFVLFLECKKKRYGWSCSQFSKAVGVGKSTISRYLSGERKANKALRKKIVDAVHTIEREEFK